MPLSLLESDRTLRTALEPSHCSQHPALVSSSLSTEVIRVLWDLSYIVPRKQSDEKCIQGILYLHFLFFLQKKGGSGFWKLPLLAADPAPSIIHEHLLVSTGYTALSFPRLLRLWLSCSLPPGLSRSPPPPISAFQQQ